MPTRETLAAIFVAAVLTGCISSIRSTSGGRKEARRECLRVARGISWDVLDISEAKFLGSAHYEVLLTVERDGVPRQQLRCAYDYREGTTDLSPVPTR